MTEIFNVEIGKIITDSTQLKKYSVIETSDGKIGLMDEFQFGCTTELLSMAKQMINEYVSSHKGTYGIIARQKKLKDKNFKLKKGFIKLPETDYSYFQNKNKIVYSIYEQNGIKSLI